MALYHLSSLARSGGSSPRLVLCLLLPPAASVSVRRSEGWARAIDGLSKGLAGALQTYVNA